MTQHALEQKLSRQEQQQLRNRRTGLAVFQISWIMAFVCLIIVNFWIRGNSETWPPAGVAVEKIIPTLMTLVLVASSFFIRRGVKALKEDNIVTFSNSWRYGLILGGVFAVVMAYEFFAAPGSGQFFYIYRLMIGFHHIHALVIGYYLIRVYQNGKRGAYSSNDFWPVEGGASLWDFVTVAWVLFYVVLYII
ncbi:MAG: cytochrome c oxidase subunit 3 [Chloroflexota bacterium]|nr:cytochrome c oxidase subunit 3 [Anaerolineae bacterium]